MDYSTWFDIISIWYLPSTVSICLQVGYLLPRDPLDTYSEWTCSQCDFYLEVSQMQMSSSCLKASLYQFVWYSLHTGMGTDSLDLITVAVMHRSSPCMCLDPVPVRSPHSGEYCRVKLILTLDIRAQICPAVHNSNQCFPIIFWHKQGSSGVSFARSLSIAKCTKFQAKSRKKYL